jgi:cell shape-determining protein MreC
MTFFQIISLILLLIPIVGTVLYHIFVVGKVFLQMNMAVASLGSTIEALNASFSTTVQNLEKTFANATHDLEKTFNLKLDNLSDNFAEMKKTQEKSTEILNEIVLKQMRDMDRDLTKVTESAKSAHHRLDCIENRK